MRTLLTISLILFVSATQAQKYSKAINDSDILQFMNWLLTSDSSIKNKHVDNDIIELNIANFRYMDTSKINNFLGNIFVHKNHLDTLFNSKDADFFVNQILNQKSFKWNFNFKNIKLFDEIQLNHNNGLDYFLYSYSLPIFSINKKYVIIIESFFCGFLCGGGEYSLYERINDFSWKKIKEFNTWAE